MEKIQRPVIYDYFEYREYLNHIYNYFKQEDPSFSHRKFLLSAGIPGSTYLLRIMNGERKLPIKNSTRFSEALGLDSSETAFFHVLVQFCNEKNYDKRNVCLREMLKIRAQNTTHALIDQKLSYFERWYYPVVRDLLPLVKFNEDYNFLGRMLLPPIKACQAEQAVKYLLTNEFIRKNEDGTYEPTDQILSTPPQITSTILSRFHRKNLEINIEMFDIIPQSKRSVSSLTVSVSEDTFQKIRVILDETRKKILAVTREGKNPDKVCHIGLQLIPRARVKEKAE
jgi:uncharacterized protein (TIGR02147 family)